MGEAGAVTHSASSNDVLNGAAANPVSPPVGTIARGYACIALDSPKCEANVGGALRAAYAYRAALIVIGDKRFGRLKSLATDTGKAWRHIPAIEVDDVLSVIPLDCVPVAVDMVEGARSLPDYTHPERAFYIFGGEDRTLDQRILSRCRDAVLVPTRRCMNLAATVNVVLYDRMAKAAAATLPKQAG